MSLRAKLIWAFLAVVLAALIPAAVILNLGMARQMGPGHMMWQGRMGTMMETRLEYMSYVRRWSILAGAAAFALAGGAGLWVAGRITRSLSHLREAAHHLDLRDLSRRVPVEGRDEIADLAQSFNHMADRLEAEERSRRQLLADVAHELRHPLSVMKGRLELMQEGRTALEPEALLPLEDEVIRMTRLVGDLRDLSLAEVGGLSLNRTQVDLGALLSGLLINLEPVAAAKEIALTAAVEPGLTPVDADPDRIRQVLLNLITNALQYTGQGGRVSVEARVQPNRMVAISVADTGPGIAPEDLPYVFDRFYRGDKSRSRATGGSGLGLAIVRSLVELHHGKVSVQSKPGEGTCFTLTLPADTALQTHRVGQVC
ncbi:MAG TPA: ATP-binding protein [Symbiobacteriaceae bacterium]|nr:ATP-binding protein [Symbiobacteriaceae bacterium]